MIDGTYAIEADTPLGHKSGTVTLTTSGDVAHAEIDAPILGKQQVEGKLEGDGFSAEGTFKLGFFGTIDYTLKCVVEGDKLDIDIDSSKGAFKFSGARV